MKNFGRGQELQNRLREQLEFELGPEILSALEDPDVLEVLLNSDGSLWLDRLGGMERLPIMIPAAKAESLLGSVATYFGAAITPEHPILEAVLPFHGFRIAGLIPPLAEAPVFSIRKPPTRVYSLAELVTHPAHLAFLREALSGRHNIVISGGTGSGKTTFANSLLNELALLSPDERIIVIEDIPELRLSSPNAVSLTTTREVSLATLVRTTLRLRPDRIVVGEVRGREAHDLLKAWNTGHPGGIATVHANSAQSALERLDQLAQEANVPSQRRRIEETVDLVVHLVRRCVVTELVDLSSRDTSKSP